MVVAGAWARGGRVGEGRISQATAPSLRRLHYSLNTNIDNNFVNNTTLSTLSTAIDYQFELTTTYIDDKITEKQEYTDQEIEALRVEGYIQEALTQAAAWITSDEGKRFRKKVWDKIKSK